MRAPRKCRRPQHLTVVERFGKESVCGVHPDAEVESIEDSRGWVAFQCEHGCWLGSILAGPA